MLKVQINNFTFQILNLYALNAETQLISEGFMGDIKYHLDRTVPALICGDFNMVEDIHYDKKGRKPRPFHTYGFKELKKLKQEVSDVRQENHSNV